MRPTDVRFKGFLPVHEARLRSLVEGGEWKRAMGVPGAVRDLQKRGRHSSPARNPEQTVVNQLRGFNEARVKEMISSGVRDREVLLEALSRWPEVWGDGPELSFLGLTVLTECNFRCIYCNKERGEARTPLGVWREVIQEAVGKGGERGVYIHFTGGEPLLLGEDLYGDEGLIRYAVDRGAAVNLNTNASLITPAVAMKLVGAGLSRLHVSLDTHDRETQNRLIPGGDRFARILTGLSHVQIAREIAGIEEPQIHINCVLTRHNVDHLVDLLAFLLDRRKIRYRQGDGRADPDLGYRDLLLHVIPVGGRENADIRPTADDFQTFYTRTWQRATTFWDQYQGRVGVPKERKVALKDYGFYTPYLRVPHRADLAAYSRLAGEGIYSQSALLDRCYVAPTQAFVLPDGSQHWCGAHTMSRPPALGNVNQTGLSENIRRHIPNLAQLPDAYCANCPGATLYINHGVDRTLRALVETWVGEAPR